MSLQHFHSPACPTCTRRVAHPAQVLRSFWLYVGLFKLASGASPKAQCEAAATIARSTPLLLITDVHGEQETLTRLAVRRGVGWF